MPVDLVTATRRGNLIPQHVWSRWWPWLNRGVLATLDQGLVSGSNFVLAVLLARWLPVPEYGGYALALSISTLINAAHQAVLLEPMSVLGAARYGECEREYLAVVVRINTAFAGGAGLLLAALAVCARLMHASAHLPETLGALALSAPGTLLFWVLRGGCYLELAPGPSVIASLGYSALVLCGALIMHLLGRISAASMLLWAGAAAWIGVLILLPRFKPASPRGSCAPEWRQVWREHWSYGRWALAATPVMWIPENISYAFASMFLGIAQVGVLRAMMNFVTPATQLATSLGRLFNPYLSGKAGKYGSPSIKTAVAKVQALYAVVGISYAGALLLFHKPAVSLLYGNRFGESADLVAWVGAATISYLVLYAPMTGLRSIQSPSSVLVAYSGAAVTAIAIGSILTPKYGLRGAIVSLCVANLTAWVTAAWLFHHRMRRVLPTRP